LAKIISIEVKAALSFLRCLCCSSIVHPKNNRINT